jgi:Na+/H+-dicarboxylate symporter
MIRLILQFFLPITLCSILFIIFQYGQTIPLDYKQMALSISIGIKSLILFVLPFCIIVFISHSIVNLRKKALKYFTILLVFVFISNTTATLFGYEFFLMFSDSISAMGVKSEVGKPSLTPLVDLNFPQLIENTSALIIGFLLGILLTFYPSDKIALRLAKLSELSIKLLRIIVIPMLPFMIAGFAIKSQYDGVIDHSVELYGAILGLFVLSQLCYVAIVCLITCGLSFSRIRNAIAAILPAALTGLSTFSSAATMPLTIHSAEQITHDKSIARSFIPSTVNIHLVGTIVGANIIFLSTLVMFEHNIPSFWHYLQFTMYYVMAMFAAVAVPGGTVFAIAPIIETYLGATPEMLSIITALILLFDPIDTAFNISLNALLARVFEKVYLFLEK